MSLKTPITPCYPNNKSLAFYGVRLFSAEADQSQQHGFRCAAGLETRGNLGRSGEGRQQSEGRAGGVGRGQEVGTSGIKFVEGLRCSRNLTNKVLVLSVLVLKEKMKK